MNAAVTVHAQAYRPPAPAPAPPNRPGQRAQALTSARSSFRQELERASRAADDAPQVVGELAPHAIPRGASGLQWAAEQLVSTLWASVLKDSPQLGQGSSLFGSGFAGSVYGGWFGEVLAGIVTRSAGGQLTELLVEEFSGGSAKGGSRPERNRATAPAPPQPTRPGREDTVR